MKNITKYIACLALGALTIGTVTSCADDLREEFYNPDELTEPQYNLLFASALTQTHLFRYEYGPTFHYMVGYAKMLGLGVRPRYLDASLNNSINQPWTGWSGVEFNKVIFDKTNVDYSKNLNAMDLLYADMSEEEKAKNAVYVHCSDIIRGYAFQRSTDIYDDIPYSEAGGAYQGVFYAAYDTQEDIYMDLLSRLKEAATGLASYTFDTDGEKIKFTSADVLCNGDIDKWIRMANSLRLRMAMRLCHVKPDVAKENIRELISGDRMITENEHNIGIEEMDKSRAFEVTFYRAIEERGSECGAPETIIKGILNYEYKTGDENGISADRHDFDPRLYSLFQPDIHNRYIGLPMVMADTVKLHNYYTSQEIYDLLNEEDMKEHAWSEKRIPAMYNRKTFFNFDMLFPVMHAPETHLLLAEAAVRWPGDFADINAADHIKKAIDLSNRFYYNANVTNQYSESTIPALQHLKASASAPSLNEAHLSDYCNFAANKFNSLDTRGKLKFIFDQKFVDMNILNPYEIYNEARRLVKDFNGELPFVSTPNVVFMDRFYYPDSEAQKNPDNFEKVKAKNNHTTPVWWTGRTTTAVNTNGDAL